MAPKWWNIIISGPLFLLNVVIYIFLGNPVNLIAAVFILGMMVAGFLACEAIERSYRRY